MADAEVLEDVAQARQSVVNAARQLVEGNVLSLSLHGNISARVRGADRFVLTGTSTLDKVEPHDLAVLDLQGNVVEGQLNPVSREIVQMHAAIYRKRDDVGAVIHTHSPHVTAFAIASAPIDPVYEALVRFDVTEPVPVAKYGPRGSERSVSNILDVVGPSTKAVLLANHGLLAFERDMESTVRIVFVLEEAAGMILEAAAIGGAKPLPPDAIPATIQRRDDFARGDGPGLSSR